jgi:hypothetical protein
MRVHRVLADGLSPLGIRDLKLDTFESLSSSKHHIEVFEESALGPVTANKRPKSRERYIL